MQLDALSTAPPGHHNYIFANSGKACELKLTLLITLKTMVFILRLIRISRVCPRIRHLSIGVLRVVPVCPGVPRRRGGKRGYNGEGGGRGGVRPVCYLTMKSDGVGRCASHRWLERASVAGRRLLTRNLHQIIRAITYKYSTYTTSGIA